MYGGASAPPLRTLIFKHSSRALALQESLVSLFPRFRRTGTGISHACVPLSQEKHVTAFKAS